MPAAELAALDGLTVAYEVIGSPGGEPWILTPGGRFSKDAPGVRELAMALADGGKQVVVWDRPNTGASSVCFSGPSESAMQADALVALLDHLDLGPAVVAGGSGGSRVSLLAGLRHREAVSGLALWWISGGPFGLLTLAMVYCGESLRAAWEQGMDAVAALPEWQEQLERNPGNRERFLSHDRRAFVDVMERWMLAYCPEEGATIPGLPDVALSALDVPAVVFRSSPLDPYHTRATSERVAELLPRARLVEPPWDDDEWMVRSALARRGEGHLFERWPLLAPQLLELQA